MGDLFQILFKYKPFLFKKGQIGFESTFSPWYLLILILGCVAAVFLLYQHRLQPLTGFRQSLKNSFPLSLIRLLALLSMLILLFRPVLHVSTVLPRENIAALLIDDSHSMSIQDASEERTRLMAVKDFLDPERGTFLTDVEKRFQVRLFRFSREIQKVNSLGELEPRGTGTSLEASLESILREFGPAPLASVVVFTDGADNLSKDIQSVLSRYQARKISINVCALGKTELDKDVEIVQASAPQSLLPESITTAFVSLKSAGYAGRNVVVEVREDGKLVNSKSVTLGGKDEVQIVELNLVPKGRGRKIYTFSVAPQPEERITANNSQSLMLNVEDTKPTILYLEGTPRWEFKFIRQALHDDKNLILMSLLRTSGNKFYRQGVESEDNLASGFPITKDELFQFKGLIIGSIEASFFSEEQLKIIYDFVSVRGGGFMMLGGKKSFDGGKYAATVIADLLPVVLGERSHENSFQIEPVKLRLTSYGKTHLVTRLVVDETQNEKKWNSLPEVADFSWISAAKPGATVLAYGDRAKNSPLLLAAHRYGRGRAMAFMAASSWHWRMGMPHEDDSHAVFWRQALRWLVASAPDQVALEFDRTVYQEDDVIRLNVEVNDSIFTKLNDAQVIASVSPPSGRANEFPLRWIVDKDGIYSGEYTAKEQGSHQVKVVATRQGEEIGQSQQYFLVTDSNLEFYNATQNQALLKRLAAETGGNYYTLAEAKAIPEEMTYMERPNSVPQTFPLWDMPALFILICLLLISEWTLRRRRGFA